MFERPNTITEIKTKSYYSNNQNDSKNESKMQKMISQCYCRTIIQGQRICPKDETQLKTSFKEIKTKSHYSQRSM